MPYAVHKKAEEHLARTGRVADAKDLGTFKVTRRARGGNRVEEVPITEDQLHQWRASMNSVSSIEGRNSHLHEDDNDRGDRPSLDIPDSSKDPHSLYEAEEQKRHAEWLIDGLNEQEKTALGHIREGVTNHKLGELLGTGREGARRIRSDIIAKLQLRAKRTV
jgi:DNA-directed RNA polymerase specialized sigma subunit